MERARFRRRRGGIVSVVFPPSLGPVKGWREGGGGREGHGKRGISPSCNEVLRAPAKQARKES